MLLVGIGVAMLAGCSSNPPNVVASVDLQQYVGKWYEIARFPVFYESGLVGVTAEYSLNDDGTVKVVNHGFKGSLTGSESNIEGTATVTDTTTNAKLKVRFNQFPASLFPGAYWIVDLDPNYQFAAVSNSSRSTLWILSRSTALDAPTYAGILERLTANGFDVSKLEATEQP